MEIVFVVDSLCNIRARLDGFVWYDDQLPIVVINITRRFAMAARKRRFENTDTTYLVGRTNLMDEFWGKLSPSQQLVLQLSIFGFLFYLLFYISHVILANFIYQLHYHSYKQFFAMLMKDPGTTNEYGALVLAVMVITTYFAVTILRSVFKAIIKYKNSWL